MSTLKVSPAHPGNSSVSPPGRRGGSAPVFRDAAMVYAEGRLLGLQKAAMLLVHEHESDIPASLRLAIRDARAEVIHLDWLAEQGRPNVAAALAYQDEADIARAVRSFQVCCQCKKVFV